jgi:hypothetical protein
MAVDAPALAVTRMSSSLTDAKYYRQIAPNSVAERLLVAARRRIFRDFLMQMRPLPSDQILDLGVSDVVSGGANVFERSYPHQSNITACGLGAGLQFKSSFPLVRYVEIEPNVPLPFDNGSFEIATTNAVLEHAGSVENQLLLVRELCRVARKVFISVPNRFFPIEHHTALLFVHYHKKAFQIACRIAGKSEWAREENLILMTPQRLRHLAASIKKTAVVGYTGLCAGPFSSNLYLAFD